MPILKFNGVTESGSLKTFEREGGCLCILGKYSDHYEENQEKFHSLGIDEVVSITYSDINKCVVRKDDEAKGKRYEDILSKYMSMFPFMRACITPVSSIVRRQSVTFDAKNYTLNEVMFAMFHLRNMLTYETCSHHLVRGNKRGLTFMSDLIYKHGLPFWKAYLIMMGALCSDKRFSEQSSSINHTYHYSGADACCFKYCYIDVNMFLDILRGTVEAPEYKGETFTTMTKEGVPYVKNISSWLSSSSSPELSVQQLYADIEENLYRLIENECASGTRNLFNNSETNQDLRNVDEAVKVKAASDAIDIVFKEYGIDTTDLIQ